MSVLPVAAASSRQPPAIVLKKSDQLSDFHALLALILVRVTTVSGAAANCTGRHDKGPAVACMRLLTRKPSTRARSLFKDQQSGARSRYATLQGSHLRFDAPAHCRDRASPVEAISSARLCCPAPPDFGCLPRVTTVSGAAPNRPGPHDQGARRRLHAAVNPQTAARGRCILAQTSNRSRTPGHHTTLQVSHLCFGTPLHLRDRASPADAIGCTVLLSSAATFWCLPKVTSNSTELHISTSQHISQHIAARGHRGKRKIAPH